ncbi:hypothetical protein GM3709_3835 (plasmid) [Geminocystis sp. NIES-3709]|nr:hypothetical protein GM3709_3835 [Geminocystis sp. NIES-3709]
MINEYVSDLGITIKNLGIKIQTGAPAIASIYQARAGGTCGGGIAFKPRRLEAIFEDGRKLLYPVGKVGDIQTVAARLMPGILSNIAPGEGDDEAICLNLLGEEWGQVPPSIAVPAQESLYTVVKGSIKKEAVNYEYVSDVSEIGTVRLSFAFQTNWVADIIECQKSGLSDPKTENTICTAGSGISPRKLIMSTGYNNDESFKGKSAGSRDVPVSARGSIVSTAQGIVECSRCIGYKGESVPNIQLYYGGGII